MSKKDSILQHKFQILEVTWSPCELFVPEIGILRPTDAAQEEIVPLEMGQPNRMHKIENTCHNIHTSAPPRFLVIFVVVSYQGVVHNAG
jgi:hypothetical protein